MKINITTYFYILNEYSKISTFYYNILFNYVEKYIVLGYNKRKDINEGYYEKRV